MTTAHAIVYRTAPQCEHKAAKELREAGVRAYVPRDRGSRRSPFTGKLAAPAPCYVMADKACQMAFARHVRGSIGTVRKDELARLYLGRHLPDIKRRPFVVGDKVKTLVGWLGTVIEDRGRVFRVAEDETGRLLTVHEASMIRIDPG